MVFVLPGAGLERNPIHPLSFQTHPQHVHGNLFHIGNGLFFKSPPFPDLLLGLTCQPGSDDALQILGECRNHGLQGCKSLPALGCHRGALLAIAGDICQRLPIVHLGIQAVGLDLVPRPINSIEMIPNHRAGPCGKLALGRIKRPGRTGESYKRLLLHIVNIPKIRIPAGNLKCQPGIAHKQIVLGGSGTAHSILNRERQAELIALGDLHGKREVFLRGTGAGK